MIKVIDIKCDKCGQKSEIIEKDGFGRCPHCFSEKYERLISPTRINTNGCSSGGGTIR